MGVDLAAEEQFGPYLVYERLGVGGMATVHRALERGIEGFERIVALKRLLPHLAEDASFIKSFVREAKLASLLNHVNIVQIFELGRVATEYFISMEYIDGRDIRRILRHARKVTGPPPIHVTVGLLLQLCEALDYAHSKVDETGLPLGLVHRDVSPSNLLITSAGHLKVIDFGIAKAQSQQLRTQTGRVKGKLAYMAPEAIAGKELDARSDLFAAGVIAHELLTARPLFASKNEYQTLLKVQRGDIMPPSTFNQACPVELDAIVLKALARDPDQRFSEASELRDELHDMRRRYNLQTGHRDVAQWLDWAFSLEPPTGGFAGNTADNTGSRAFSEVRSGSQRGKTPRPRKDEDDAVEIAWGGGEHEGSADPVLLDDVPDVSAKHLGGAESLGAAPRLDALDDLADDIPGPQPSHGSRSREQAAVLGGAPHHAAPRTTSKSMPAQRGSHPSIPPPTRDRRTTAQGAGVRAATTGERPSGIVDARPARSLTDVATIDEDGIDTLPGDVEIGPSDTVRALPAVPASARHDAVSPAAVGGVPRTKPGVGAPHARSGSASGSELGDPAVAVVAPRTKRPSDVRIGQAIIERQSVKRTWVILVGLAAAGAAATAVTLLLTSGQDTIATVADPPPVVPVKQVGTVKFVTEPSDAEISIIGETPHVGSPWAIQLQPGLHQIQIQRDGYKAWLTSIELSPNETQTLRVVLDKLGGDVAIEEATLILSSTPPGLEAVLDGKLLSVTTPIKMPIKPGPHTIVLRQDGVDVWRHELVAQASVDYEFSPSMSEDKQRERAQRAAPIAAREPRRQIMPSPAPAPKPDDVTTGDDPREDPTPIDKTVDKAAQEPEKAPARPQVQAPTSTLPKPGEKTAQPKIAAPAPRPVPVAVPRRSGPVLVPPSAVRRVSGSTPTIGASKRREVPPVVAAKVCIDTTGTVDSVSMISKLERITRIDLANAIKSWRYAPYKKAGTAVPACFVVTMRVK